MEMKFLLMGILSSERVIKYGRQHIFYYYPEGYDEETIEGEKEV